MCPPTDERKQTKKKEISRGKDMRFPTDQKGRIFYIVFSNVASILLVENQC